MLSRRSQQCIKAFITCQHGCVCNSRLHDSLSGARNLVQPANDGPVGIGDIVDM